jgi:hypothetical protein
MDRVHHDFNVMLARMLELSASGESVSGSGGSWSPLFRGPYGRAPGCALCGWRADWGGLADASTKDAAGNLVGLILIVAAILPDR